MFSERPSGQSSFSQRSTHYGQGRESLAATRNGELSVLVVWAGVPAVSQPECLGQQIVALVIDSDDTRESDLWAKPAY